jgi:hypothetical protein
MKLITADLHFTESPHDAYRFGIFPWLVKQAWKYKADGFYILGDLTDKKDRHPAALVERVVRGISDLREQAEIDVVMGNHDFVDIGQPFFDFLNQMESVRFHRETGVTTDDVYVIPFQPDQASFNEACRYAIPGQGVLLHQMITGAIGDTGARLTGISTAPLEAVKPRWCYAGDIHTPQTVGPVTYVGSPYHTRFGEPYKPRVLLLDEVTGKTTDLYFPAPKKISIEINDPDLLLEPIFDLQKGDHVKVTLELAREELTDWANQKKRIFEICRELGVEVFGVTLKAAPSTARVTTEPTRTKAETFETFCSVENVPSKVKQAGKAIVEQT